MTPEPAGPLPETCCPALWLWPGHALYYGPSLDLGPHSGSVACLALGVDEPFVVRTAREERTARTALLAPRVSHQLSSPGGRMIFCYLDASSTRERACLARMTGDGHREESALVELGVRLGASPILAERWLALAAPPDPATPDERVLTAARHLLRHTNPSPSATELAGSVGLSTSRFLHLFREHTGTSFRRYRLWARMLRAGSLLSEGKDLTTAAVEAGFASPSHFSDSFHAMFGLPATKLLATGVTIRRVPLP
jgi:AraC-like DNA-binding protein